MRDSASSVGRRFDASCAAGCCSVMPTETVSNLGVSCRTSEQTLGPLFCIGVIAIERPVHHRGSDLEHEMNASRRPAHLLLGIHATVQQPLHRALRGCRRDRLFASSGGRIVDDDAGLSGDIYFEFAKGARHLGIRQAGRRRWHPPRRPPLPDRGPELRVRHVARRCWCGRTDDAHGGVSYHWRLQHYDRGPIKRRQAIHVVGISPVFAAIVRASSSDSCGEPHLRRRRLVARTARS
jgi:hypothetical protein